jgi:hypothetical protein
VKGKTEIVYCKKDYYLKYGKKDPIKIFNKGSFYQMEMKYGEFRVYIGDKDKFLPIKDENKYNEFFMLKNDHRNEVIEEILK